MANFKYSNKKESLNIELFGTVGESWFSEKTITIDKVRNIVNESKNKKINIKINSLGGDHSEALVIYDLLKTHGNVSTEIIGLTASAGVTVALGATSKPKMSKYASILVHNVSSGVWGNAEEMQREADNLKTIDNGLANIYVDVTGKDKDDLLNLMAQEKWLSSEEAMEWGFVSEITTNGNKVTNEIVSKINNSIYPNFKNSKLMDNKDDNKGLLNSIKEIFSNKEINISEKQKEEFSNQISELKNKISEYDKKVAELESKISSLENDKTELSKENENLKKEKESFDNYISKKDVEISDLKNQITKLSGTDQPKNNQDKGGSTELSDWAKEAKKMKNNLL